MNNQQKNQNKAYTKFGRNGRKLNTDLWCDHCERYDHTKDICYKRVGYPKGNKFGNQDKGKTQANMVQVNDGATTSTANNNYGFTSDQVKAHQEMIKPSSSSDINLCFNVNILNNINYLDEWILDTGVSAHMSENRKLFQKIIKSENSIIARLPNGTIKNINMIGNVNWN